MKFGKVDDPSLIDFTLPEDHKSIGAILKGSKNENKPPIYIGCAKWNRQDLKGFYPRGTKDELTYYSTQFNCIELNATFYRIFTPEQVRKWYDKTPEHFRFFPKIPQSISQFKRLLDVDELVDSYLTSISELKEKLGMIFLQMHPTFGPKWMDRLKEFIEKWPSDLPLAIELRHTEWYNEPAHFEALLDVLAKHKITHILTDTAGRRDLMHMALTNPHCFIRYTGANHPSDVERLDDWFDRIKLWIEQGIESINFFVHQNVEKRSPLLSAHLIERLNNELGYELKVPFLNQQQGFDFG